MNRTYVGKYFRPKDCLVKNNNTGKNKRARTATRQLGQLTITEDTDPTSQLISTDTPLELAIMFETKSIKTVLATPKRTRNATPLFEALHNNTVQLTNLEYAHLMSSPNHPWIPEYGSYSAR
ncbi:hypothetical protein DI09_287p10 [Mitosporidium daphniae]|uniref:Uncharacterized protein n=1 Tax=Mitosporidium daphniae TaxID=1485682 RepID=A0A098VRR5_9MICR|nr:uncharacterized protein DI09_287p10 [Mitosporidium daphniae]KGG51748.1 hypothetical protein DI09_287p10 [Mitosporidium daphniae]|eukprot:XP_013238184.1 uncharacterized protein DI09_287p10 [Mitosporidium daphniae]